MVVKTYKFRKPQGLWNSSDLRCFSLARHQFTLQDVPIYVPAFIGTHYAYPQRDGQAEFI